MILGKESINKNHDRNRSNDRCCLYLYSAENVVDVSQHLFLIEKSILENEIKKSSLIY